MPGMADQVVAFLGIAVLLIITPGPDMALVLRNTLLGGRRSGVFTALGIVSGLVVWTLAASAGVAALLVAFEPAFVAVKLAGAAYLIYLGGQALWGVLHPGGAGMAAIGGHPPTRLHARAAFRQGLVSNLGNPKIAVFFTSFLPQFTSSGDASFSALLLLGLLFSALGLAWLTGYAVVVAKAGAVLVRPAVRRTIEALTGAVLVALGLRLASAHR